jgi:hypothetical protein
MAGAPTAASASAERPALEPAPVRLVDVRWTLRAASGSGPPGSGASAFVLAMATVAARSWRRAESQRSDLTAMVDKLAADVEDLRADGGFLPGPPVQPENRGRAARMARFSARARDR